MAAKRVRIGAHRKKILLVGESRQDYIALLQEKGYEIDGPHSLEEAQFLSTERRYDLILLEVGDSARAALRFCGHIRQSSPRQRLMFLLGTPAQLSAITCPPDGVAHRREGPEHLLERVEELLAA